MQLRYFDPALGSPSSSSGIRMLLNGQLDFAQSDRPINDEEYAIARREGFTLKQSPVAIDGIAVVVNRTLKVPGLTIEQLQQIYRGQLTNWRQVGGPDLPITPFSQRPEDADTVLFSGESVLDKQPFGANVQYLNLPTARSRGVPNHRSGFRLSVQTPTPQQLLDC